MSYVNGSWFFLFVAIVGVIRSFCSVRYCSIYTFLARPVIVCLVAVPCALRILASFVFRTITAFLPSAGSCSYSYSGSDSPDHNCYSSDSFSSCHHHHHLPLADYTCLPSVGAGCDSNSCPYSYSAINSSASCHLLLHPSAAAHTRPAAFLHLVSQAAGSCTAVLCPVPAPYTDVAHQSLSAVVALLADCD